MSSVHPSAIGSGSDPRTASMTSSSSGPISSSSSSAGGSTRAVVEEDKYPEQRHAGKVGYGPAYNQGPTIADKVHGLQEEVKGKITRNPALVQTGKERASGALKEKKRQEQMNDADPFANPEAKAQKEKAQQRPESEHGKGEKERAATVAPEGTPAAESQRKSEASDNIKHIG